MAVRSRCWQAALLQFLFDWQVEIGIAEYFKTKETAAAEVVSLYMDALLEVGVAWYDGEYPVVLMDNITYLWTQVAIWR